MRTVRLSLLVLGVAVVCGAVLLGWARLVGAHCQVPCGIFDDHARVQMVREDAATVAKAMREIVALSKKGDPQSLNQATRWVMNKETHADRIMHTVGEYFLAQRIVPAPGKDRKAQGAYVEKLIRHHAVMVAAMKCKQSTDPERVQALEKAIDAIAGYWPANKK